MPLIRGLSRVAAGLGPAALLLALPPLRGQTATSPTVVHVGAEVVVPAVKRFGMNLGSQTFYDSGQLMKNLVFRNPGFEGEIYQGVFRCAAGTATTCTDDTAWAGWPAGFWNGATFEAIWGRSKGRTGLVTSSTAPNGKTGALLTLSSTGTPIAVGDYLILRRTNPDKPEASWWVQGKGGSISPERKDLSPETPGKQAIRASVTSPDQSLSLLQYFDNREIHFLRLSGFHHLTFLAKGATAGSQLSVRFARSGLADYVNTTVSLSDTWSRYTFDFLAQEDGTKGAACELEFKLIAPSTVLLDDVALEASDGDPANTTVFRDAVVDALRDFNPGILRYWGYQLGESLDNQIAAPFARQRAGFSAFQIGDEDVQYGLHEFLELCAVLHTEPWYVVPTTFSPGEMANLIEYLQGAPTTAYGAKRAARGRTAPWTDSFPKIHLEFGNEAWNSTFRAGTIESPDAYGNRATEMFGAARAYPGYLAAKFDLVAGGQHVYLDRNQFILNSTQNHDTFTVAGYFAGTVDTYDTAENLFGPLLATPEFLVRTDYLRKNYDLVKRAGKGASLAIYEFNLHTTGGAISQDALKSFATSAGAGVAVATEALLALRELSIRDQMLWQLGQFDFNRPDGKNVRLFGATYDMGVTDRRRPQFLALKLVNEAVAGNMVKTVHTGADPAWDQPLVNQVQLKGAHYLQSFAFTAGDSRALVLVNLHRTATLPVTFADVNAPRGPVLVRALQPAAITDTNESEELVGIDTRRISSFDPAMPFPLPPYSVTVLSWRNTLAPSTYDK